MGQLKKLYFITVITLFLVTYCFKGRAAISVPAIETYSISAEEDAFFTNKESKNLYATGRQLYNNDEYEQAALSFKKALMLIEKSTDSTAVTLCYYWTARCYRRLADYTQYQKYLSLLLDYAQKINNKKYLALAYEGFGNLYRYIGDYPQSLENYAKSIEICEEQGNYSEESTALNNMSLVYEYQGKTEEQLKLQLRNYWVLKKLNNKSSLILCLSNLAGIYQQLKQKSKADEYLNEATKLVLEVGADKVNFKELAAYYGQISSAAQEEKRYDVALEYCTKSLELMKDHKDKKGVLDSYASMATIYSLMGKDVLAEEFLLKQLEGAKNMHYMNGHIGACSALADLKTKQGDYKSANTYLKEYTALKDSLTSEKVVQKMAESEARFNLKNRQELIKTLYRDMAEQRLESGRKKIIYYGIAVLSLLVLIFAGLFFRMRLQKSRRTTF